ncbi:MAG TPA: hypothetical protein VGX71_25485 [Pseudaminobacter sp.]|nr:hypothetical protein [Pseudaminobacter sp.]
MSLFYQLLNRAPASPSTEQGAAAPQPLAGTPSAPRAPPHEFPHLTTQELAARWRVTVFTLSGNYQKWGLRPIKIGKRLLFPLDQIEAVERRSMMVPEDAA